MGDVFDGIVVGFTLGVIINLIRIVIRRLFE